MALEGCVSVGPEAQEAGGTAAPLEGPPGGVPGVRTSARAAASLRVTDVGVSDCQKRGPPTSSRPGACTSRCQKKVEVALDL